MSKARFNWQVTWYVVFSGYIAVLVGINLWQHNVAGSIGWSVLFLINLALDYWWMKDRLVRHEFHVNIKGVE